jgi:hypothetical protein
MQYMLKLANVRRSKIIKRFGIAANKLGFDTLALGDPFLFISLFTSRGCLFSLNEEHADRKLF